MKAIDNLYQSFSQFEEKFGKSRSLNSKMMTEAQAWMDRAK